MADDKKEKDAEKTEEAPKPKSKMLLLVVGGLLLAGGGAGAAFFLMPKSAPPSTDAASEAAAASQASAEAPAGLVPLDTFLVNLRDADKDRYMKTTMRLAVVPDSAAGAIRDDELMLARIRDRILTLLMQKTFQELTHPVGKEGLRQEIQSQVTELLKDGEVTNVLFSEFVVQ